MCSRAYCFALGLAFPLILSLACEGNKSETAAQSKEEIIAEYEAAKAQQERVEKLEQELADLKKSSAAQTKPVNKQIQDDHHKQLEKQIEDAKAKAEQANKDAEEAKNRKGRDAKGEKGRDGKGRDGQGERAERGGTRVINLAKGTKLTVALAKDMSTDTHKANDTWEGQLTQDITVADAVVWTAGTSVRGLVSQSTPTGRLANGEGALAVKLTNIGGADVDGGIYVVTGDAKGTRNAKVIGGTAALGALVGILSDKNNKSDHALGGAAIGAAAGTAVAAATAKTVITISAKTPITFEVPTDEKVILR